MSPKSTTISLESTTTYLASLVNSAIQDWWNKAPSPISIPKELEEDNQKLYKRIMDLKHAEELTGDFNKIPANDQKKAKNIRQNLKNLTDYSKELFKTYTQLGNPEKDIEKFTGNFIELYKDTKIAHETLSQNKQELHELIHSHEARDKIKKIQKEIDFTAINNEVEQVSPPSLTPIVRAPAPQQKSR